MSEYIRGDENMGRTLFIKGVWVEPILQKLNFGRAAHMLFQMGLSPKEITGLFNEYSESPDSEYSFSFPPDERIFIWENEYEEGERLIAVLLPEEYEALKGASYEEAEILNSLLGLRGGFTPSLSKIRKIWGMKSPEPQGEILEGLI